MYKLPYLLTSKMADFLLLTWSQINKTFNTALPSMDNNFSYYAVSLETRLEG